MASALVRRKDQGESGETHTYNPLRREKGELVCFEAGAHLDEAQAVADVRERDREKGGRDEGELARAGAHLDEAQAVADVRERDREKGRKQ